MLIFLLKNVAYFHRKLNSLSWYKAMEAYTGKDGRLTTFGYHGA